ncbi:hypothetical protein DRP07_09515 [Archaeoglobales archaeon]|mgnify:CR=1 FL=1|nr:MAG: hypothetical protein DRP07_09515 [Archaeoglobales archaeon]
MAVNCAVCKGNLLCGRQKCPLLQKFQFLKTIDLKPGNIEKPTPPSAFVGRMGYPSVFVGPLISTKSEDPEYLDSPWLWEGNVEDVIGLRMSLLRGVKRLGIESASDPDKFLLNIQEATASVRPVSLDAEVDRIIRKPTFGDTIQPIGISAGIKRVELSENPKIPAKVEKAYYDDLKSVEAVKSLFDSGFSTYYLQKIFSLGMLGMQNKRKLVPTRWSITAVHDILGEEIKKEIALYPEIGETLLFSYEHFGNHFEIIFSPAEFSFQLVEIWIKKSFWSPEKTWIGYDGEGILPKRDYSNLSGGYYAARLPVLEYMRKIGRKASVIVLREISPAYYAPLGVWVVEEGVRRAMNKPPLKFDSFDEALRVAAANLKTDSSLWAYKLKKSIQTTLGAFFS